ncbi:Ubiquitin carboxyl-terminal hydrolase [Strongyloides ratti]|uniref:Ubiquitin carboxyl-terminal hydrolase n=1 Tax=Strongyloides ratti TaxID=34506 RepID=A0A090L708_STRRB|nr:Ubiquitin carboxyl-terminal hydrolase [Strongyloides ratti]CEF63264.1 Ubiquitin carboxyl-terminal hydrolase [Strongyloides ratti]
MANTEKVGTWLALESNPETLSSFIMRLGIKNAAVTDVYGFDESLIEFIPRPHHALIVCLPDYDLCNKILSEKYNKLIEEGKNVYPEDQVFFMQQKISNACGTFALFHALANSPLIDKGTGSFAQWLEKAKQLPMDERSKSLFNDPAISEAHEECAKEGETDVPEENKVEHHFMSYVNVDGILYEFDSTQRFPRNCGETSEATFIMDTGKELKPLLDKLNNISFSAMALISEY